MNRSCIRLLPALLAVVLLGSALGGAAEAAAPFIFTIPVELDRIPERVGGTIIYCNVYNANGQGMGGGSQGVPYSRASGQFSGNVSVGITMLQGQDPYNARTYRCHMVMTIPGNPPVWDRPSPTSAVPEFQPKPGTEFVGEVSGTLPTVISPKALDPKLRRPPMKQ